MHRLTVAVIFTALVSTVWFANYLIEHFGAVSVGFGLLAPAGVYAAGLAFVFRDVLHELAGRWVVAAAILAGAALSWWVSPAFAVASATAFLASEAADWFVYSPLRETQWTLAVVGSNIVGIVVDSVVFLSMAFGSLAFLPGQIVGKCWMTLAALAVLVPLRRMVFRREPEPA